VGSSKPPAKSLSSIFISSLAFLYPLGSEV
jgi:hypothetical protein